MASDMHDVMCQMAGEMVTDGAVIWDEMAVMVLLMMCDVAGDVRDVMCRMAEWMATDGAVIWDEMSVMMMLMKCVMAGDVREVMCQMVCEMAGVRQQIVQQTRPHAYATRPSPRADASSPIVASTRCLQLRHTYSDSGTPCGDMYDPYRSD